MPSRDFTHMMPTTEDELRVALERYSRHHRQTRFQTFLRAYGILYLRKHFTVDQLIDVAAAVYDAAPRARFKWQRQLIAEYRDAVRTN